eukprot:TRINITY_DN14011_c0_g1_i2.p1 TRINITY_DN14011_c0_g1~~TRINITY_DN14011_c0_g1_i2.p1  ORF type:complete len:149 (+),score=26.17 TRINITY_DN14011_c0_g1_i2:101-547(+)
MGILFEKGARLSKVDKLICTRIVFSAVKKNDISLLRNFLAFGCHPLESYVNPDSRNLGHAAVVLHRIEVLKFLKEETSFNFNLTDRWGKTPIDEAMSLEKPARREILFILTSEIETYEDMEGVLDKEEVKQENGISLHSETRETRTTY